MGPPAAIFLNRAAGSARSASVARTVDLVRRGLDADLHETATRDAGELVSWMDERAGGYSTIVIAGGDGSLSIAYNVLADRGDTALAYIPAGFGNATAHLLRLPREPDLLAATILRGDARAVDLVDADGRLALFAGMGWDAVVAGRYADAGARGLRGWASAVTRSIPDLVQRRNVSVVVDGRELHAGPMELLVVSTTPWYGRGMLVNPGASVDAGRLTLRVYPGPAHAFAVEALRWMARRPPTVAGHHAAAIHVTALDGRSLPLQADGDAIGASHDWRLVVRPRAVRLIGNWPG